MLATAIIFSPLSNTTHAHAPTSRSMGVGKGPPPHPQNPSNDKFCGKVPAPDLFQCYPGLRVTSFFSRCQFSWLADDERDTTLPPTDHSLKVRPHARSLTPEKPGNSK